MRTCLVCAAVTTGLFSLAIWWPETGNYAHIRGLVVISVVRSGSQRNTLAKFVCRTTEPQRLSRTLIELKSDLVEICLGVLAEIRPLWQILTKKSVGVLVRSPLPGAPRVAEIDVHLRRDREVFVVSHFETSVPGQGLLQLLGKTPNLFDQSLHHRRSALVRNLDQHHIARLTLDERGYMGVVEACDQIPLPMARNRTILDLGRALTDRDRIDNLSTGLPSQAGMS